MAEDQNAGQQELGQPICPKAKTIGGAFLAMNQSLCPQGDSPAPGAISMPRAFCDYTSPPLGPGPWPWSLVPGPGPCSWSTALVPGPGQWSLVPVPGPWPWSLVPVLGPCPRALMVPWAFMVPWPHGSVGPYGPMAPWSQMGQPGAQIPMKKKTWLCLGMVSRVKFSRFHRGRMPQNPPKLKFLPNSRVRARPLARPWPAPICHCGAYLRQYNHTPRC